MLFEERVVAENDRLIRINSILREGLEFILKWNTEDKASQLVARKTLDKAEGL